MNNFFSQKKQKKAHEVHLTLKLKDIQFNLKDEVFVLIFTLLMLLNLISAIFVIYNKHEERKFFAQIQNSHKEAEELKIKQGQLLLEKSSLASLSRIEAIAEEKLHLHTPYATEIQFVEGVK